MAKAKAKTVFFCKECGYETPKWMGQCPGCHQWNTMTEEKINPVSRGVGKRGNNLPHQQLTGLFMRVLGLPFYVEVPFFIF